MALLTPRRELFTICLEAAVLTESVKKLREPLAYALLAATALYVVTNIVQLLKSRDDLTFGDRSFVLQDALTNPVWVLVVLAALALVVADRPSPHARTIAMVALGLLGLMLLVGLVSWLASYGSEIGDFPRDGDFTGQTAHTFLSLARLLVLGAAAALAYTLWKALPAPQRQPQQFPQQWGQQPGQQQWGQPGQPGQYGQPNQPGPYGAPAQGQGQWSPPAGGGWGQPQVSAQPQQSWGQHDPYAAPPAASQPPAGYAAGSEHGAYAAPPEQVTGGAERPTWGQPAPEQTPGNWGPPAEGQVQGWDRSAQDQGGWSQPAPEQAGLERPSGASTDPESTRVQAPHVESEESGESPEQQQARENEQRPGWWPQGS
jgi:hypothetical protein